ncbi:MAG: hypothetical protein LBL79_06065 [Prevotella sp.]|jgi:hypothetical protein|nr:hypothetical protein [Prevotella sp.]
MNGKLLKKEKDGLSKENKPETLPGLPTQKTADKPKKRKKRPGRKRIRRSFDETRIAHFLKHEAPLEYQFILDAAGASVVPSADLIEAIGYASANPLFKKPKFRRSLMKYRKEGLYCGRVAKSNANIELYYIRMRSKQ